MTNTIQKNLKVSSTQLLYQSSPFQAAILFVTGPFLDQLLTKRNVFAYNYSLLVLVCNWSPSSTNSLATGFCPCMQTENHACIGMFCRKFVLSKVIKHYTFNFLLWKLYIYWYLPHTSGIFSMNLRIILIYVLLEFKQSSLSNANFIYWLLYQFCLVPLSLSRESNCRHVY